MDPAANKKHLMQNRNELVPTVAVITMTAECEAYDPGAIVASRDAVPCVRRP